MTERASFLDLYEDAPCGFMSVCVDGKIVRINHTLTEWLGQSTGSLIGSTFHDLLSVGGRIAYETHIRPLLRMQGHADELSLDLLNSEGERVPFLANATERRGEDGQHISTRFALFKARDRRMYEKSLLAAREVAETESRRARETALLREQFIAVLGHDLRNPLTAIISGTNLIKRRVDLPEREASILDNISKSAWRAEHLIRDVLDFARGKLGEGLVLQRAKNAKLADGLTQVVDEVRTAHPEQEIVTNFTIEGPVNCDGDRIGQLLSNLLSNAVNHGDSARKIIVSANTTAEEFVLHVENFGDPIPEALQQNLFQPFFRGNASDQKKGLGLGLFIVSEIAKAHGGSIAVISDSRVTRFTLCMPR
ncbi:MAG: PAS domain-containing sensor histidine kinase [Hellea sp.]|nr:PAS domain-containing sensor histidine kinase [Hellea sp.]